MRNYTDYEAPPHRSGKFILTNAQRGATVWLFNFITQYSYEHHHSWSGNYSCRRSEDHPHRSWSWPEERSNILKRSLQKGLGAENLCYSQTHVLWRGNRLACNQGSLWHWSWRKKIASQTPCYCWTTQSSW